MVCGFPDFIHVGPPRTGTTWLHEVLKSHVNLPEPKETRFFDEFYRLGSTWYFERFGAHPRHSLTGEIYPGYFANPLARKRIRHHIPNCRILCTFREPATRLYSVWRIIRARRLPVDASFEAYWRRIVSRGSDLCRYADHLASWQRVFGKEHVLVLFYEDLSSDPQNYLDGVCKFLGLPAVELEHSPVGKGRVHEADRAARQNAISQLAGKIYSKLGSRDFSGLQILGRNPIVKRLLRPWLVEQFEPLGEVTADEIRSLVLPETERLEEMTGRDLSAWKPQSKAVADDARVFTQRLEDALNLS